MKRVGQIYREKLTSTVKSGVDKNKNLFLLTYSKISGPQLNDLRKNLKKAGAKVAITRNAAARIALKDLKQDKLADRVSGQTAFVWSNEDSVEVSKILVKFLKDCESIKLQGGLLEGKLIEQSDVKKLSDLPPREVLLSQLLGTMQGPLTRFAGALNAKSRDLLSILKQLSEKTA